MFWLYSSCSTNCSGGGWSVWSKGGANMAAETRCFPTPQTTAADRSCIAIPSHHSAVYKRVENRTSASFEFCRNCKIRARVVACWTSQFTTRTFYINFSIPHTIGSLPYSVSDFNEEVKNMSREERQYSITQNNCNSQLIRRSYGTSFHNRRRDPSYF